MTSTASPLPELPAIGFLTEVDPGHRAFLASFGRFIRPGDGEFVIEQGKPQDCLYLILSGQLHVVSDAGDRPVLIASLGAGDSLGEVNVFDPDTASASVIAKTPCLIWEITGGELDGFMEADPAAGIQFMRGLLQLAGHRIRAMNLKLAESEEKSAMHSFWTPRK